MVAARLQRSEEEPANGKGNGASALGPSALLKQTEEVKVFVTFSTWMTLCEDGKKHLLPFFDLVSEGAGLKPMCAHVSHSVHRHSS